MDHNYVIQLRAELSEKAHELNETADKLAATSDRLTIIRLLNRHIELVAEYDIIMRLITLGESEDWKKKPLLYRLFHKN